MCPYYCQNLASANQFKIPGGLYNYGATEKNQASSWGFSFQNARAKLSEMAEISQTSAQLLIFSGFSVSKIILVRPGK